MYYAYGAKEIVYLRSKDPLLGKAIDHIGPIERPVIPDLFEALVSFIIGQQISAKAWQTIRARMLERFTAITAEAVSQCTIKEIQQFGTTFKKAATIKNAAEKVLDGVLNVNLLKDMTDDDVCRELSTLHGVGVWTAQMILLLSMQRPDIVSFGDLAIRRGMSILYQETITKELFETYRCRYSPYGSVASLYLWAIAAGGLQR